MAKDEKKYVAVLPLDYLPAGKRKEVHREPGDPVDDLPKTAKVAALVKAGFIREVE